MEAASNEYDKLLGREARQRRRSYLEVGVVFIAILVASWYVDLFDFQRLWEGLPDMGSLILEMLPPDFTKWQDWIMPLIDTLCMSIGGTAFSIIFSLPIGFLAARNTTPNPVAYQVARAILSLTRAVPELILGIVLVAAVGFGVLPGALALGIHSIGMVGKFFAESIEHVDHRPVEAVESTGANRLQIIIHGYLPQVIPQMADTAFYRWEYNFRASTLLGIVGAGGIGFQLIGALRILRYDEMFAIILVILGMVMIVDGTGAWLRRRFK
ncbi:MAG: phosphonate ABC transporter, permease protein PhnE [Verrucomicrobiota bacterium]